MASQAEPCDSERRVGAEFIPVTFVIPVRPGCVPSHALEGIRQLEYPPDLVQVLIAWGYNPSQQRNTAVAQAMGEIVYFLDDDPELAPRSLLRVVKRLCVMGVLARKGLFSLGVSTRMDRHLAFRNLE